jgi:hypothetical protein
MPAEREPAASPTMTATQQPDALPFDAASMPHQAFIRQRDEDWAGITNQRERKRLQNRLNQRARG